MLVGRLAAGWRDGCCLEETLLHLLQPGPPARALYLLPALEPLGADGPPRLEVGGEEEGGAGAVCPAEQHAALAVVQRLSAISYHIRPAIKEHSDTAFYD